MRFHKTLAAHKLVMHTAPVSAQSFLKKKKKEWP